MDHKNHAVIINGSIRFDGVCGESKPFCGAVCCKSTIVLLDEEEKNSGKYDYIEPTEGCDCAGCKLMKQRGKASLRRRDGGCVYLDGMGLCSIYDIRPKVCKEFKCDKTWWKLQLANTGN